MRSQLATPRGDTHISSTSRLLKLTSRRDELAAFGSDLLRSFPRLTALFVVATLMTAAPAWGQSRFAVEVVAGPHLPLSPSVRSVVQLDAAPADGDDTTLTPRLVDRRNGVGVHVNLSALLASIEVHYRLARLPWRGARVVCVGDREVRPLPNGDVEDADVRYDCNVPNDDVSVGAEENSALVLHHLGVARRFYLRRRTPSDNDRVHNAARLFLLGGGGVTLATYRDPNLGAVVRGGVHVDAGGGLELPVEQRLWVTAELRYTMTAVGGQSSPSARSGRAVATERNVLGALADISHRVGVGLGVRFDFR